MINGLDNILATLTRGGSMSSAALLARLHACAYEAGTRGNGVVVEIGAYRGASTVALALGLRAAGRGHITSIDPHRDYTGVLGGRFSAQDHDAFSANLQAHGVASWVTHHCSTSAAVAGQWSGAIDLLWIDGDHSYDGVAADLRDWLPFVADGGLVILDDHAPGSEVEAAVRDCLPFAFFQPVERVGNTLLLRRQVTPRTMFLCGGMQSSGSTLVSWCFLQRPDLDGVYDMDNALIHQDFSRVMTACVWVKMTIGAFRLEEVAAIYASQGWQVRPLLVTRALEDVLDSLQGKYYGVDGVTGDDPPLLVRCRRYLRDVRLAGECGWPVIAYESLLAEPQGILCAAGEALGLRWDEAMVSWPKPESAVSYMSDGNVAFGLSRAQGGGVVAATATYAAAQAGKHVPEAVRRVSITIATAARVDEPALPAAGLSPAVFRGTRRQQWEARVAALQAERERILNHVVFGPLLRLWRRFVNPSLPSA